MAAGDITRADGSVRKAGSSPFRSSGGSSSRRTIKAGSGNSSPLQDKQYKKDLKEARESGRTVDEVREDRNSSSGGDTSVSPMAETGVNTGKQDTSVSPMAQSGSRPVLGSKDIQPFDLQRDPQAYNQRTTYQGTQLYTPEVQQQMFEAERQQQRQEAVRAMDLGQSERTNNLPDGPGPALVNARTKKPEWEKTAQAYESGVANTLSPLTGSDNPYARFGGGALEVAAYAPTAIPRLGVGLATNPTATIRETVLGQAEMIQKDPARGLGQIAGMAFGGKVAKALTKAPKAVPYRLTKNTHQPGILLKSEIAVEAPKTNAPPGQYTIRTPGNEIVPYAGKKGPAGNLPGSTRKTGQPDPNFFVGKETQPGMAEVYAKITPDQFKNIEKNTIFTEGSGQAIKTDYGSFRVFEPYKPKTTGSKPKTATELQGDINRAIGESPGIKTSRELPFRLEKKQDIKPVDLEIKQPGKVQEGNIFETTAGDPAPQIPKKTKGPYDPITPEEMAYAKILTTSLRDEPMYYQAASKVSSRIGKEMGVKDISDVGLKIWDEKIFNERGTLGATGYLKNTPIRDIHIAGTKYQPPGEVVYTLGHELGHATQKGGTAGPTMTKEAVAGKFGTKFAKKFEETYGIEVYKDSGFADQPISARIRDPYKLGISMESAPIDFARTSGRFRKPSGKPQKFKEVQSLDRDFYIEDYKPAKTRDPSMLSDLMKEPVSGKSKAKTTVKTKESTSPFKDDLQALVDASQAQFRGTGRAGPNKQVFARPNINQKPKGMTGPIPFANFGYNPGSQFHPGITPDFKFKPPVIQDPFSKTGTAPSTSPSYSPTPAPGPAQSPTTVARNVLTFPKTPKMAKPKIDSKRSRKSRKNKNTDWEYDRRQNKWNFPLKDFEIKL